LKLTHGNDFSIKKPPHRVDFKIIPTEKIPHVRRIIDFPPRALLLPWQANPAGNVRSEAANPGVSTPHWLRSPDIPKPMSVNLVVMLSCHHLLAMPSKIRQKCYECRKRKLAHLLYFGISLFCTLFFVLFIIIGEIPEYKVLVFGLLCCHTAGNPIKAEMLTIGVQQ